MEELLEKALVCLLQFYVEILIKTFINTVRIQSLPTIGMHITSYLHYSHFRLLHLTKDLRAWGYRKCHVAELTFQANFWIYEMEYWNSVGISSSIFKNMCLIWQVQLWERLIIECSRFMAKFSSFPSKTWGEKNALFTDRNIHRLKETGRG